MAVVPYPASIGEICRRELGLDLTAFYGKSRLDNPIMIASGQMTRFRGQIDKIVSAGYGGFVFKSFVGECLDGRCSMETFRRASSFIKSVYDQEDVGGEMPIIHWSGRLDTRPMQKYLDFVVDCSSLCDSGCHSVYSFLCHLPKLNEDLLAEEWLHTVRHLMNIGAKDMEIDFCPFLQSENMLEDKCTVLRWYRECTSLIKAHYPDTGIYPKLINPLWDKQFYLDMMEAAVAGGADGLTIANRFFRPEYGSGHGGRELREKNLELVSMCKKVFPDLPIAATGGIYTGRHVFEYLRQGASSVQLLSFVMGKVYRSFICRGSKYRQVMHELIFEPEKGLAAAMLEAGVNSVREAGDLCVK